MINKQVVVKEWCRKNSCFPESPFYAKWLELMKKWDNDFTGYWGGGTYDSDVLEWTLKEAKS